MDTGYLILETGDVFEGTMVGKNVSSTGEVVFNTSMTGYQEIMTDPSYTGQIITFCYPLIGNYGINHFDNESIGLHLSGAVISDLCTTPSHYLAIKSFAEHLANEGIPCLAGVDTRAIVKKIRKNGTMKGVISKTPSKHVPIGQDNLLVKKVSTHSVQQYEGSGPHIVLVDYGYKKSMLEALLKVGCKVSVVPYSTTFEEMQSLKPEGVMFSNGPGDPMMVSSMFQEVKKITENFPSLGICLGHQIIALAYGAKTSKLLFGHRGGNHPVKEIESGKVWMTPQNHGYVVTEDSINHEIFGVTYRNINDQSIEGLKHKKLPIVTVQFHPESHPGPSDTEHIFKEFLATVGKAGDLKYATTK
ncbi:carbamoyl phosphate synthase small subunit [Virgibacillus phasianinus]|uniref:Carbamoyl phosphate synthase small chain n=1 Tax=Virgibacillus phasianinus TaxID=2017483 RepID=A0A220U0Y3_9BACI|nr:carbamoyl phosphate synthase small subunit [Virgibacillus phasianinus]ASK61553.1 carbamoyl phosphate synthase small subunit [Virgibacillus phasianinus]